MTNLRSLSLCALAGALLGCTVMAQTAVPKVRIVSRIDNSELVTLRGNVNPHANARNDLGPVSADFSLPDLTLVLSRSAAEQAAFDAYVAGEYDPNSPYFHQWLTPSEIGERFGPAQADIDTISSWLTSQGFTVKGVSPDRMAIKFAGTASSVDSAFHTQIHNLSVHGVPHYANMTDPQIPAALAPVVVGIKALHNFLPKPLHKLGNLVEFNAQKGQWQRVSGSAVPAAGQAVTGAGVSSATAQPLSGLTVLPKPSLNLHPQFGINGSDNGSTYLEEDVTPWDFATIYNVTPAWNAGYTGSGQTIAIVGTSLIAQSNVNPITTSSGAVVSETGSDVATYRSTFDLPALASFTQIDTKAGAAATECTSTSSSAACGIGDLEENTIDVELSGAVATGAPIELVVTGQNTSGSIDTVYDSASYVVDNVSAKILSVSYGECELGQGTAENVAYYDLWQAAAAEGISVFVASGDSGAAGCDDDLDAEYGNPYVSQYGLGVSGIASTPFDTAVGGTDFSWCQPYYTVSGNNIYFEGCASSSTSQGSPAYWNTSNDGTTGASASNYVPEIPWNDTCENPIQARFLETLLSTTGADSYFNVSTSTPEQTCSVIYNGWSQLDEFFYQVYGSNPGFEDWVDTVGGSGGVSGCVVNSTNPESATGALGSCNTTATSTGATTNLDTGAAQASLTLVNGGWPSPAWQNQSGVTGTSGLTARAIPDVSFFAGNGALDSATLVCISSVGACTYNGSSENTAQEIGGTSVASPEMAGVMALIDQKAGAAQGLANPELYKLASMQTYSDCSAETANNSSSCYFQDIDNGPTASSGPAYTTAQTISMPCNLTGTEEGGDLNGAYQGLASPNCYAMTSGDAIGTLGTSSTTAAYNSTTGFDLATGLGSLNVYNVVRDWASDMGVKTATLGVTLDPSSGSFSASTPLAVTVTVSGSYGTPTGSVAVVGAGYSGSGTLSGGQVQITIPAGALEAGSDTLTITYGGDGTYASASTTEDVTVTPSPTYTISATTPAAVAPGGTATSTISGANSSSGYAGTVSLSCTLTSSSVSNPNAPPTCGVNGTITYTNGTPSGTATATVSTTAAQTSTLVRPAAGGKGWLGGGGAVLAFLVFLGIPSRRKSWRAMLGMVVMLVTLGSLMACGSGSSGSGSTTVPGTTAANYTFTVTGTGSDAAHIRATTTFTVTVN